jgi:hypothetical protein
MKNKLFLLLAIIAMVAFVVVLGHGYVWAQQGDDSEGPVDPKSPIDAKFTDQPDRQEAAGGDGIDGPLAGQILQTKISDVAGNGFPKNVFMNPNARQVDALANRRDAGFGRVIANTATLLVSFQGDTKGKGIWKVWYETRAGVRGVRWSDADFNNPPGGLPADVDGLQLYGGDANRYSEDTDPAGSVLKSDGTVYVPLADIVAAITNAALGPPNGVIWNGVGTVDLDGLMAWDGNSNNLWDGGDTIIFSIKPAGNWDGGEIVVLPFTGQPGSARYLNHGGHLWNTAFTVAQKFGVDTENVDAIECYSEWYQSQTPTLTQWGVIILVALLISSGLFIMLRRRKAAVPA